MSARKANKNIKRKVSDNRNNKKTAYKKKYRKLVIWYKVVSTVFIIFMLLLGVPYIFTHKQKYRSQGIEFYESGNYEEAINSFQKALDEEQWFSDNVDADVLMYQASAYLQLRDYSSAKNIYEILQNDYSGEYDDLYMVSYLSDLCDALIKYQDGKYSDSLDVIKEACDSGYTELSLYTAVCYESIREYDEMKNYLDIYVQTNPIDAYVYSKYADMYIATGDYSSAVASVESALALNETEYMQELYYRQIYCYEKLGNYEKAYELSETYVNNYPDDETGVKLNDFLFTRANPDTEVINDIFGVNPGAESSDELNESSGEDIIENPQDSDSDDIIQ